MKKAGKHIGQVYKEAFDGYEENITSTEWSKMESKLNRKRFFLFSFRYFNIYYCSLIAILCLLIFTTLLPDQYPDAKNAEKVVTNDSISEKNNSFITHEESVASAHSDPNKKDSENRSGLQYRPSNVDTSASLNKFENVEMGNTYKRDSSLSNTNSQIINNNKINPNLGVDSAKAKQSRKVVYITKQDTLFVTDTITVKKKGRKKLK
jgi:hypothetical protein